MPSAAKVVSSGARQRSSDGATIAMAAGSVPPRTSSRISSPTSSSAPREPAPSRKRTAPSSAGGSAGASANSQRSTWAMRRSRERVRSGRQLLDVSRRLPRERRGRSFQDRERQPPGLVRQRDSDVRAARQRLDERPLRRCQVLEPVGVDRPPVPRVQLVRHPLGGVAPLAIAVPASQPVELGAIRAQQLCQTCIEVLRLDEPGLELRDGRAECLGEAREPGSVPRQPSQQQRPLGVGEHGPVGSVAVGEAREQVVERRHPAADDGLAAGERDPAQRAAPRAGWARAEPGRARCPPHSGRAGERPCRRSRAPQAASAARHPV